MSESRPLASIVVPAYNEESSLASTVTVLLERLSACVPSFEILVVDDASTDATGRIAERLSATDGRVKALHHDQNQGIGGAFATGSSHAAGDWLLFVPADLPLDPDEIPKYFEAAEDVDIVVGIRSDKSDYTPFRRLVSWTNIRAIQLLFGMPLEQFQYVCLYRTRVLNQVPIEYTGSAFFLAEVLIRARASGFRLRPVPVRYSPRVAGNATGASPALISRTARDMLRFWWGREWRAPDMPVGRTTTRERSHGGERTRAHRRRYSGSASGSAERPPVAEPRR